MGNSPDTQALRALMERLGKAAGGHALAYGHTGICGESLAAISALLARIEKLQTALGNLASDVDEFVDRGDEWAAYIAARSLLAGDGE